MITTATTLNTAGNHDHDDSYVPISFPYSLMQQRSIDWLWPNFIPFAKLSLLVGDPGTGKSLLALHLAAALSRGRPIAPSALTHACNVANPSITNAPFDQDAPSPQLPITNSQLPSPLAPAATLILSADDAPHDTILPRLVAMGADLTKIHSLPNLHSLIPTRPSKDGLQPQSDPLARLEDAILQISDLKLIIIDPLAAFLGHADDSIR